MEKITKFLSVGAAALLFSATAAMASTPSYLVVRNQLHQASVAKTYGLLSQTIAGETVAPLPWSVVLSACHFKHHCVSSIYVILAGGFKRKVGKLFIDTRTGSIEAFGQKDNFQLLKTGPDEVTLSYIGTAKLTK